MLFFLKKIANSIEWDSLTILLYVSGFCCRHILITFQRSSIRNGCVEGEN